MIKVKRTEVDDLVLTVNLEFLARKGLDTPLGVGVTVGLICGGNIFSQLRHHLSKIIISDIEIRIKISSDQLYSHLKPPLSNFSQS